MRFDMADAAWPWWLFADGGGTGILPRPFTLHDLVHQDDPIAGTSRAEQSRSDSLTRQDTVDTQSVKPTRSILA